MNTLSDDPNLERKPEMNAPLSKFTAAVVLARIDLDAWLERRAEADLERGSHTTDVISWAIAIVVIVGIAVAFLTGFVNKLGNQLMNS